MEISREKASKRLNRQNIIFNADDGLTVVDFKGNKPVLTPFTSFLAENSLLPNREIVNFSSSAFVDVNADCVADIVLHTRDNTGEYVEVWLGKETEESIEYVLAEANQYLLPEGTLSFVIEDIDQDGSLDLLLTVQTESMVGYALMNSQIKVTHHWLSDFCVVDPVDYDSAVFSLGEVKTLSEDLKMPVIGGLDARFKTGDFNLDGMPDLLTAFKEGENTRIYIIFNENGEYSLKNSISIGENGCVSPSFIDLLDNGKLDIICNKIEKEEFSVSVFLNGYSYDSFFIKAITFSGDNNRIETGTNYRFVSSTIQGDREIKVNSQQPQLGSRNLSVPFGFTGIGRSNNYIENFHVISVQRGGNKYKRYTPVIPNSQLIIFKEQEWKIKLFVKPTDQIGVVLFVLIAVLALLMGGIVYYQSKEEYLIDEAEKRTFNSYY